MSRLFVLASDTTSTTSVNYYTTGHELPSADARSKNLVDICNLVARARSIHDIRTTRDRGVSSTHPALG